MFIYKITNKNNNKVYIGQTIFNIDERFKQHIYAALKRKTKSIIYAAIRKYGPENFTIEEIDGANSMSELNYLETHYIYKFNSLSPNGYNLSSGGGNKRTHPETKKKLSLALKGRKISQKHKDILVDIHSIEIHQYDLEGNYIRSWKSAMDASRSLNIENSEINKCGKKRRKMCGGFMWRYTKEDKLTPYKRGGGGKKGHKGYNAKKCALVDSSGKIIKEYESAKLAAISNSCDVSTVCKICNNKLEKTKGLIFSYI
jgi:hypothetical protein